MTQPIGSQLMQLITTITENPFEHEWLTDEFADESKRQAVTERGKKHHYVPKFYLDRWALDGLVQPTQMDTGTVHQPQKPSAVATKTNLYTLPDNDETMDLPLRWVEKHLSRIEGQCARRLNELDEIGPGKVVDAAVKADLAVFLGFQLSRTLSQREHHLTLIKGPVAGKRRYLRTTMPNATEAQIEARMRPQFEDPKHEAIHLMFSDVRRVHANLLYKRRWAVYRASKALITCDDPVVAVAGPPFTRSMWAGAMGAAVFMYPIDPDHLLVMLRPNLHHKGSLILSRDEVSEINREIAAAAHKTTFERPGDHIAGSIEVPPREATPALDDTVAENLDEDTAFAILMSQVRRRSRWSESNPGPEWPVQRWYRG